MKESVAANESSSDLPSILHYSFISVMYVGEQSTKPLPIAYVATGKLQKGYALACKNR